MRHEDAPTQPLRVVPGRSARHRRFGARRLVGYLPVVGWAALLVVGVGMLAVGAFKLGDAVGTAARARPATAPTPAGAQLERPAPGDTSEADPQGSAVSAASPVPATPQPSGSAPDEQRAAAAHDHERQRETAGTARAEQEAPGGPVVNALQTLGRSCEHNGLEPHNGFQEAPRCVSTAMGEVAAAEHGPQLLITSAPDSVQAGEEFTIQVSSRNLVRDRFLGAADGGYYAESFS